MDDGLDNTEKSKERKDRNYLAEFGLDGWMFARRPRSFRLARVA